MRLIVAGIIALFPIIPMIAAGQKDVFASDQMRGPWPDDVVVLQAGFGQTLVFRDTDPPYVLDGRKLIIAAETVRVEGKVVIRSFRKDDVPLPKSGVAERGKDGKNGGPGKNFGPCLIVGCDGDPATRGHDGADGESGRRAESIELQFPHLIGSGALVIAAVGQQGQQGQRGGQGGTGGSGGKGKSKTCSDPVPKGKGGNGGPAGYGGNGGNGGSGGGGGDIDFPQSLQSAIKSGLLVLYADGGLGGLGALGGDPGNQGARGEGADGTDCENGTAPGELGDPGTPGDKGFQGDEGFSARIHCSDCPGLQSFDLPSDIIDGTIVVEPASGTSQEVNNHGERKRLRSRSEYIDVHTEDGKNCVGFVSDAFASGEVQQICQSARYDKSVSSVRLLDSPTLAFVAFGPNAAATQHKVKEVCDVFLSCK